MAYSRFCILAGLILVTLLLGACESDEYGSLICPPGSRDTLLVYAEEEFLQISVYDNDGLDGPGICGMESLYLGEDGENRSQILVNYDFSALGNIPDQWLQAENILSVYLRLMMLYPYIQGQPAIAYEVLQLAEPFSPDDYFIDPGPAPETISGILNAYSEVPNSSSEPRLQLPESVFVSWVDAADTVGLAIRAGEASDPRLVGFASRDLTHYFLIPPLHEGSAYDPVILVRLVEPDTFLVFRPVHDTSTFELISPVLPDQILVQTGVRSYPVLKFVIPPLAEDVCLAGLGLRMDPVTIDSLVQGQCLSVSHIDSTLGDWTDGVALADSLAVARHYLFRICDDGAKSRIEYLPPVLNLLLNFPDPNFYDYHEGRADIYFSQSTFQGPTAAPEVRPVLMLITGSKE